MNQMPAVLLQRFQRGLKLVRTIADLSREEKIAPHTWRRPLQVGDDVSIT